MKKHDIKIVSIITAFFIVSGCVLLLVYTKLLPWLVSNEHVINFAEQKVAEAAHLELTVEKPELITGFNTKIAFKADKIIIKENSNELLDIKKIDTEISLKSIFKNKIVLNKLFVDYIFADIDKLTKLSVQKSEKTSESKWSIDFLNADLGLKEAIFIYSPKKNSKIRIKVKDIVMDNKEANNKFIHFDIEALLDKNNKKIKLCVKDKNKVVIKNNQLYVNNIILNVNNSSINICASSSEKNGLFINLVSKNFQITDINNFIVSNLIIENGEELMSYFNGLRGNIDFDIKFVKNKLSGLIHINDSFTKIIPLNDLPLVIKRGTVKITPEDVVFDNIDGYYGKDVLNKINISGKIRDYNKLCETDVIIKTSLTNNFSKNYLSPLVGIPLEIKGRIGTIIKITCLKNNIDVFAGGKLAKENDILVDGASLTPVHYDRAFKADLHFYNNILNIEDISYYIAKDIHKGVKIKPIMQFNGNVDCAKEVPELMDFGLKIPNPLPSEFLNLFVGPKFFNGGKFVGNIEINNMQKVPKINGKLEAEKIKIPSQRTYIKKAEMYADRNLIHIISSGTFKRTKYDFNGEILNEIKLPVVIKNVLLTVDNLNVERLLKSFNTQNSNKQVIVENNTKTNATPLNEEEMEDDEYVIDVNNLIIENCCFKLKQGFYKDIKFGNLNSTLTLDRNNILELKSNKFDIAEGTSGIKVFCDLKKHKYWLKLGIKDVNSDLISTTLLNLSREISGKARGFIELNTDESLKMNGTIKFSINDGQIQKIGLVEYLLKFASIFRNPLTMITPSIISDIVNVPEGNFKNIKGELIIKNNDVKYLKIQSTSEKLSALIRGRYNIGTGDASLRIYTKFSNSHNGWGGFVRNFSLNSLANKISFSNKSSSNYYASELEQIPKLEVGEDEAQVFLTTVDGDIVNFNFLSSLKKIK